jgi:DNA-binding transcriptional ArsR family regulator
MLAHLSQGPATVNQLAGPFDMSLPAISKHIRVLEDAGFVKRGRDAQFRPCSLDAAPIEAVANWTAEYRHIWDARFNRMDALLNSTMESLDE